MSHYDSNILKHSNKWIFLQKEKRFSKSLFELKAIKDCLFYFVYRSNQLQTHSFRRAS